jgi:coenzyme Q-binding protein COQ10
MPTSEASMTLSWSRMFPMLTAAQLYALVCDIEGYSSFVPGCIATRILSRLEARWVVDNVIGAGPLRFRFTSIATFTAPSSIDIQSADGPWRHFAMRWRFEPENNGCRVDCHSTFAFRSKVVACMAEMGRETAREAMVRAFEHRARLLFGGPTRASSAVGSMNREVTDATKPVAYQPILRH